jgi:DNA-directed RNA polymerase I subunit RPA2
VNFDIGAKLSNFLATGNLSSPSGLDLQQTAGFTILAEKLNWLRYISHFRCVHRGAFFAELKTTTVRKLLPEAWGERPVTQITKSFNACQDFSVRCIRRMVRHVVY